MKDEQAGITSKSDRWAYLWLVAGIVLLMLSAGRFGLGFAAWLAPVFLIRFYRSQRLGKGYGLSLLGMYIAFAISWHAVLAPFFPLPVYLIFIIFVAVQYSLPYLADRLLAPHIKGFAATLVFPLAMTSVFYLYNLVSPMGSWGTVGYEQYYNLVLIQLVSVTGLWGLTLLVNWLGPVVNWAWEQSFNWTQIRRGLAIFGGVVVVVFLYGGLRLSFSDSPSSTVQVHGLNVKTDWENQPDRKTQLEAYRRFTQERHDQLIQETIRQAGRGAQLVLWTEMAASGVVEDIEFVISRGKEVAQQENIYLAMGLEAHYPDQERPWDNKLIVIAPSGEIILDHDKYGAIFMYGVMGDPAVQGDFVLDTAETPFGTLTGIVCWDADFPMVVRQSGAQNADILLLANGDNPGHFKEHAQMAIFRAIENGVSLVRQDARGLSLATDPYGRVLAMVDIGAAAEPVMSAKVPTQGVFTLYPIIGDLFGWISVLGFAVIMVWVIVTKRREG
jgi:apolipoprotein N-acyltransferase